MDEGTEEFDWRESIYETTDAEDTEPDDETIGDEVVAVSLDEWLKRQRWAQHELAARLNQDEGPEPERSMYHRIGQPMCVACGRTIFECLLHDEDDLEIIRRHENDNHRSCDSDACADGGDKPLD